MKKNIILYMVAVAGLVLAGCSKESVMPQGGSLDMTVTASVGEMTKVAYDGLKTTFTKDDSLSVYAWIGSNTEVAEQLVVNGVVNKLDEKGKWVPASQMLWKNARDDHYFIGISPAHEVVSFTADPFVLNPAEYKTNDLLIANDLKGQKVTTDLAPNPVSLTFTHALAKLNVHLKFRSQWAATPTVTSVATTAMDCYKVNYLTKEVTAYGDAAQVALQPLTTTPETYALSFSGLQVPQTGVTVITIKIDGKDFVYTAAEPIVLESGKITNIGLIVGREELFLDKTSVEDWAEGETYKEDGEAMEDDAPDYVSMPLTFEALTDGAISVSNAPFGMQLSINGGEKINVPDVYVSFIVHTGDKFSFYGDGTSITSYSDTRFNGSEGTQVKVYGNIMSLVDEENFATATVLTKANAFSQLFVDNNTLVDAGNLILPATTLSADCYANMFGTCENLTAAPALPATELAKECYFGMFQSCTSLAEAPVLPAAVLVDGCYYYMFYGCSKLASVTCLATDISAQLCTSSWLLSAGDAVEGDKIFTAASASVNWSTDSGNGIPEGWTRKNAQ